MSFDVPNNNEILSGMETRLSALSAIMVNSNHASEFMDRLVHMINDFNMSLDNEHEAGLCLVHFGKETQIRVSSLGYYNPSLIVFYGKTLDNSSVQLIQHISQINFLLISIERQDNSSPKQPIGFKIESKKEL